MRNRQVRCCGLCYQLLHVTSEDYILGISDLTGELMRYATNGPSSVHFGLMPTKHSDWNW